MLLPLPSQTEVRIDLSALAKNYQYFANLSDGVTTAAAVKADAYGLGMAKIAPVLRDLGCEHFFVAHHYEGVLLRQKLGRGPVIYVLHGPGRSVTGDDFEHDLVPVLNSVADIRYWQKNGQRKPAALHFDTGINRLGINYEQAQNIDTANLNLSLIMSHLACASSPQHALNSLQLARFKDICTQFTDIPASLANSAGIVMGSEYHFDLTRPGIGLYGGNPLDRGHASLGLAPVATIMAPVLQVRSVAAGQSIGYGARFCAPKPMKVATIAYGYADGLFRAANHGGHGWIDGQAAPIVGRISMDMTTLDVSAIERPVKPGDRIAFMGADLNDLADTCQTIAYELLTNIGPRVKRIYMKDGL